MTETGDTNTADTTLEFRDGLGMYRKKNTRNSTHQLARRQNLMNNQKLVLLHSSVQDNQSAAGTANNLAHLTDYQALVQRNPKVFSGYPN